MTEGWLALDYLTPEELAVAAAGTGSEVLGIAAFAPGPAAESIDPLPAGAADIPVARVPLPPLSGESTRYEVWRASGPLRSSRLGAVHCRDNGRFLFGCIAFDEAPGSGLTGATESAYAQLFDCLAERGFGQLLRVWNYFPAINVATGALERYRQFNAARQNAFRRFGREVRGQVPAACALGCDPRGSCMIYFLAGTGSGVPIENPRQVPAYDYPARYGAHPPTFSRAMLTTAARDPMLFISGTASIRGSRSRHPGDVRAQAEETVTNLHALIEAANRRDGERRAQDFPGAGGARFDPVQLHYKAYLRHPADRAIVEATLREGLAPTRPILWLRADVCRADLLLEIEAAGPRVRACAA
jgi:hypothetical protein